MIKNEMNQQSLKVKNTTGNNVTFSCNFLKGEGGSHHGKIDADVTFSCNFLRGRGGLAKKFLSNFFNG